MLTLFPFFCESPQRACVHLQELFAIYLPLWYTALITYVNVILNLNLYRGEFNAARCLQVQVYGGGTPIERVCLLQGRAEVQHKASPPSGKVSVRFLCVDQVEFISCELSKKKYGEMLCLQEGSVWFVRVFFFTLKTVLLRKYVCASDKIFFYQILTFHSVRYWLDLSYTLTLSKLTDFISSLIK